MDYQLVIVKGSKTSQAIQLADGVTSIGRHDDCQLRIRSSQVSRRHCEVFEKKGLLLVKDLGSSNGTFVNGKKVEGQRVLEPGDELTVGQVTLRVVKSAASAPKAAAAPPLSKPGDTSIGAATASAESGDEFEVEFDAEPEPTVVSAVAKPSTPAPAPAAAPHPEPVEADDAVADFLLGIKLDDEE